MFSQHLETFLPESSNHWSFYPQFFQTLKQRQDANATFFQPLETTLAKPSADIYVII